MMSADGARGVALAFELAELAIAMRAQQCRRRHPLASDEEVTAFVQRWLFERPGAPDGDAIGRATALRV